MSGQRTDVAFIREVLADRGWHSNAEILRRSFDERGCGMTVHSRIADLRRKLTVEGLTVESKHDASAERGAAYLYRITDLRAALSPITREEGPPVGDAGGPPSERKATPDCAGSPRFDGQVIDICALLAARGFNDADALTDAELDRLEAEDAAEVAAELEQPPLFDLGATGTDNTRPAWA